jgi:hypothetical protein
VSYGARFAKNFIFTNFAVSTTWLSLSFDSAVSATLVIHGSAISM